MKNIIKTLVLASLLLVVLSGCGNKKEVMNLSMAGSTSMEKVCEALMEVYEEDNEDYTVTCEYTGSGAGLESLASGSVDIGNASRKLKQGELDKGLVENIIALDGIAVIADKNNTLLNLSKEELSGIYTGAYTNWSELGGEDMAIVVIGRENGSGTRDAFEELLGVKDACVYGQELDSTGGVLARVSSTEGAIGYVSFDVVNDDVKAMMIDNVVPSEANIVSGSYVLQRPFVMATKAEVSASNDAVKSWFAFIESDQGKEIIKSVGLIPVR